MLRDGNSQLEGSPWYTVDWIGWKLISWNLASDPIVSWVNGNGVLNGNVYIDSFQLSYAQGNTKTGFIIIDDLRVATIATPIANEPLDKTNLTDLPSIIELFQNYPNPFNPSTHLSFSLPESEAVRLVIYDLLGREIEVLVQEKLPAGHHQYTFDASSLASGVYLYRLESSKGIHTKKMTLIK